MSKGATYIRRSRGSAPARLYASTVENTLFRAFFTGCSHAQFSNQYDHIYTTYAYSTIELRRGGEILYKRDFGSSSNGGYNSFNRMASREAPVEIGKQYDVKIEEIARQGDGIARIEGFVTSCRARRSMTNLRLKLKLLSAPVQLAKRYNFSFREKYEELTMGKLLAAIQLR